jgi:hypothetical protein
MRPLRELAADTWAQAGALAVVFGASLIVAALLTWSGWAT